MLEFLLRIFEKTNLFAKWNFYITLKQFNSFTLTMLTHGNVWQIVCFYQ